jgi:hypothetical protein
MWAEPVPAAKLFLFLAMVLGRHQWQLRLAATARIPERQVAICFRRLRLRQDGLQSHNRMLPTSATGYAFGKSVQCSLFILSTR